MLVILSGSSGAGKNTVINEILRSDEDYRLLPTFTTREKRENEKDGEPYCFVTEDAFRSMLEKDELIEHQIIHGHYYGVGREKLLELSKQPRILIKDIDVLGTLSLLKAFPKKTKVLTFFYKVPKSELVKRLKKRGEQNIELRLQRYELENELACHYDYILENTDLKTTVELTKTIVAYEKNSAYLLPTVKADSISKEAVARLLASATTYKFSDKKEIIDKPCFPSIKASVIDKCVYIVEGHNEYLAARLAGVHVAKEIVSSTTLMTRDKE